MAVASVSTTEEFRMFTVIETMLNAYLYTRMAPSSVEVDASAGHDFGTVGCCEHRLKMMLLF